MKALKRTNISDEFLVSIQMNALCIYCIVVWYSDDDDDGGDIIVIVVIIIIDAVHSLIMHRVYCASYMHSFELAMYAVATIFFLFCFCLFVIILPLFLMVLLYFALALQLAS